MWATAQRFRPRVARALIIAAVAIQLADTQFLRRNMASAAARGYPQVLSEETWRPLLAAHQYMKQYPSFQCGGWAGNWPDKNSNMELLLLAAKLDLPSNSAYLARPNRSCGGKSRRPEVRYPPRRALPVRQAVPNSPARRLRGLSELVPRIRPWNCLLPKLGRGSANRDRTALQADLTILGPTIRLDELLISTGGNGAPFLSSGWSVLEGWGVWSIGHQSEIALRLSPPATGDLRLTVTSHAYVHPGRPTKEIGLFVNERQVTTWRYTYGEGTKKQTINISRDLLQAGGLLELRFVSEFVKSPKQAGLSNDLREVSLGLVDLMLSPLPTSQN